MRSIPPHLDLFGLVILLGVAQGLFLGIFFLTGSRSSDVANRCLGWLMLGISALIGEIFLSYSNYLFSVLDWVDFSEPVNFSLAPLFFLYVFARIRGRLPRHWGWHFLPTILWTINAVTWMYQPVEFKYNNYLEAWHPELPSVREPTNYISEDFSGLRGYVSEMTLVSSLIYNAMAIVLIRRSFRQTQWSFWGSHPALLARLRNLTLLFCLLPLLILIIKLQFQEDLGDYLIACYLTAIIYVTSFLVMSGSSFFRDDPANQLATSINSDSDSPVDPVRSGVTDEPRKKYEKSSLSGEVEDAVLRKLDQLLVTEKPYLQTDMSLPKLAAQLGTSPHHLSQLLNDRLGQRFFDWLATYRIAEAQRLLHNPDTAYLKIDEIAERVGYNSPSAFHTAFKRITNQTPAQFRDAAQTQRN